MRLCGISSRFQLLSPSTRQVTHALLTRPPLTYISLGFNVSPFDLHVLGTPPAFILSQDQTLMLKWCLCPASFIWHCLLLIRVASRSFSSICLFLNLAIHFSENLGIFRVALLFICQRSVILRCCCSQRQLWYLIMTAFVCQQLFKNFFCLEKLLFFATFFILLYLIGICQQLFQKLFKSYRKLFRCLGTAATTKLSISPYLPLVNTVFYFFQKISTIVELYIHLMHF